MAKIVAITDMSFLGSGYFYIMTNLLKGLAEKGHDITIAGLGYMGEPHNFPFQVIPCGNFQDALSIANNMYYINRERKDVITIVGMDIPHQINLFAELSKSGRPYIAITPMENGPLLRTWANGLSNMAWVFMISDMAKKWALAAGLTRVDHLTVGVDSTLWHLPKPDERMQLRKGLGLENNEFVVLTVADNQERKNLSAGMEVIASLKGRTQRPVKYFMVTKEDSFVGWNLRDYAAELGITAEFVPFQRGLPTKDLWGLYAVADAYLQPSKAEGLGMPVLEAMGCGLFCVCTDTGAMHELIWDNTGKAPRGVTVPPAFSMRDVWGNSTRDFIDVRHAAEVLADLANNPNEETQRRIDAARAFVEGRTWESSINQVDAKITDILNGQAKQA